jgi:hypothetical protein
LDNIENPLEFSITVWDKLVQDLLVSRCAWTTIIKMAIAHKTATEQRIPPIKRGTPETLVNSKEFTVRLRDNFFVTIQPRFLQTIKDLPETSNGSGVRI